jgi:SAM-dependent methyltransferase
VTADYGLDAPPVVRNLLIAAACGLGLWAAAAARLWSGTMRLSLGGNEVRILLAPAGLSIGLACLAMALWMIWSSRVGKLRERERLLDRVAWRGDERVLDLGCGRGLMVVGAARRLQSGDATGVDLWRATDLAGNTPAALRANAAAEGVAGRVRLTTGDMCSLPFADASFDAIVSRAAVHNVSHPAERRKVLEETARVLRPGGSVVLSDIRHLDEYATVLRSLGLTATVEGSAGAQYLLGLLTFGDMRPGVVRAFRSRNSEERAQ